MRAGKSVVRESIIETVLGTPRETYYVQPRDTDLCYTLAKTTPLAPTINTD